MIGQQKAMSERNPDFPPPAFEVYRERMQRGLRLTIDPPPTQE